MFYMKQKNINKKKMIIFGALVLTIVVVLSGITYAFFSSGIKGENEKLSLSTGTMALTFADNDNGINAKLNFGESVTKKFKIINTGTLEASMSLDWVKFINTYTNGSLSYNLSYSETEDGTYTELIPETNMPTSSEELTQTLAGEISVPAGGTYYYNLTITLNDLDDVDQTADGEAEFRTMFSAGLPLKYRYYTLTVDPNGGTWGEFTAPQTYQLKNNETMNIIDVPTREGYIFNGWKLTGTSSEFSDNVFTMGISDASLVAEWELKQITVTVNGVTQEASYGSTINLGDPTKEGYTFAGWSVTGGTVEGNTLTVTGENDITVTPTYTINTYKYIVYHNKQNVDGNGYTLVSADTDVKEAEYNTTVTPSTKTYTGFTSPNTTSLTIQVEDTYPPVLNKVEYNYTRNKHNLTIDPNGGTYNSSTSSTVINVIYYGAEYALGIPTKTGYNFINWSTTSGSITDNTFTMGDADATVTANWTAQTYTITFNANGGTIDTQSKVVTYDNTYGALPEPTYSGYTFDGWFTEQTGGTQILDTTKVTITANQTLYAHWTLSLSYITLTKLGKKSLSGTPSFSSVATTDETSSGLYSMADDYGTSYYYRGAVTDNYVKFAGFYWRIIRVNGDGSLRIIYDGTVAHSNRNGAETFTTTGVDGSTTSTDRFALTSIAWNTTNADDAKYVGYMYGGANGEASTSLIEAQTNETDTNIKTQVESWYSTKLSSYDDYIADAIYCNDRSTPPSGTTWWTSQSSNLGYGTNATPYGAFSRFLTTSNSWNTSSPSPQFTCSQKNDRFTVSDTTNGNRALTYKVGLITADEIVAAGGLGGTTNYYYYLSKSSNYWYWSLSPRYMYPNGHAGVFYVNTNGGLSNYRVNGSGAVAPVISLKAEYAAQLEGSGTASDPFYIQGAA